MKLAPICLFTYNRLDETKLTIEALQNNFLANESEIFIFSDGWKNDEASSKVLAVRRFLKTVDRFKSVTIFEADKNKGLANSIIDGVTKIINRYGKVIVLEDDLVTSKNFLDFMNQALIFFEPNEKIFSISGFSMNLPGLKTYNKDFYLGYRSSSWGWGTWKNRWDTIDWEVKDYKLFIESRKLKRQFKNGGSDLPKMLSNQMSGKIDSWAIRWCYQQFKNQQLTVIPTKSKVENIGFGINATHTKKTRRFHTRLDHSPKKVFLFDNDNVINNRLNKQFKFKFSLFLRLLDKFF